MTAPPGPLTEAGLREHVWPRCSRVLAQPGVYLANHSLGRPLDRMADDVAEFARIWQEDLDQAWDVWPAEQARFTANVERLIGAAPGTVTQRASAGQGLRAVLNSFPFEEPIRVVTTEGEFDSIDFILRAYAQAGRANVDWVGLGSVNGVPKVDAETVLANVTGATDLVVVSHVFFGTGHVFPNLLEFVAKCRHRGALVLVDVYHSAGAMPVDVTRLAADFAVGGGYKYLRGGPGAAWLYVAPTVLEGGRATLDTGWFAKAENFDYHRGEKIKRRAGIGGWAESTPPVIATYQARSGLEFTLELGVDRIRAYGLERQALMRSKLQEAGVRAFEPSTPEAYGAFSLVPSDEARQVCVMAAKKGLAVDSRGRMIRLCPDVLNSVEQFEVAAGILAECLQ